MRTTVREAVSLRRVWPVLLAVPVALATGCATVQPIASPNPPSGPVGLHYTVDEVSQSKAHMVITAPDGDHAQDTNSRFSLKLGVVVLKPSSGGMDRVRIKILDAKATGGGHAAEVGAIGRTFEVTNQAKDQDPLVTSGGKPVTGKLGKAIASDATDVFADGTNVVTPEALKHVGKSVPLTKAEFLKLLGMGSTGAVEYKGGHERVRRLGKTGQARLDMDMSAAYAKPDGTASIGVKVWVVFDARTGRMASTSFTTIVKAATKLNTSAGPTPVKLTKTKVSTDTFHYPAS